MTLYIVGAGGFGRETLDVALAAEETVEAFLDDYLAGESRRGLPVLPPDSAETGARYVVAIANPAVRRNLVTRLSASGLKPATLVHPRATIAPETTLGVGCIVLAGAYLSSDVTLGTHVQVNYNSTIGHDARLDDYATVYPGANVAGAVHLFAGSTIGANAAVLQGRTVGENAFVGAGAVVTRDVEKNSVVAGVPARALKKQ